MKFIAHAGGAAVDWEEASYSNALSTFEYNYNKGFRLFEVDFIYSREKHLQVCGHGWEKHENEETHKRFPDSDLSDFYNPYLFPSFEEINYFLSNSYEQMFDQCNQLSIMKWMQTHPDVTLILDIKMLFIEDATEPS